MLIDTHCHLDTDRFDPDRAAVIARARQAGVARMITIGCDVANSERALGLACTHRDLFAAVGVHPHEAGKVAPDFIDAIERLSAHPRAVAIGECGLDYYYDNAPRTAQREVFVAQVRLATRVDLPLVIHVRDAWDDLLTLLRAETLRKVPGVIHCFTGTSEQAKAALELGFYLSIPGIVTFSKPGDVAAVAQSAPLDRLLIETDSPFLAPKPHRGKRNEPAYVRHVAEKVAELRNMPLDDVITATGENATRLFGIS